MPRKAKENDLLDIKNDIKKTSKVKTNVAKNTKKTTSKTTSKKATQKKTTTKKTTIVKQAPIAEYYDLPTSYNKTIVKILAQTPTTLFVYWEISSDDINSFKEKYGDNFFETTRPILIIYNDTLHYSFEVEINDFANSWYLHVADAKSDYRIELGRRPIQNNSNIKEDYIYISSSNEIESPNNHVLFNNPENKIHFKNVKTNIETAKDLSSVSFMIKKAKNIYDIYENLYKDSYKYINNVSSQFK